MYFQGIITICCFGTAATVVFLLYWNCLIYLYCSICGTPLSPPSDLASLTSVTVKDWNSHFLAL